MSRFDMPRREPPPVYALIGLVAAAAGTVLASTAASSWLRLEQHAVFGSALIGTTLVLQLASIRVKGRFAVSFSSAGMLAVGFVLGPGAAIAVGVLAAVARLIASRGRLDRALFDAGNFALAAAGAAFAYDALGAGDWSPFARLGAALVAAASFYLVNTGLLALAMSGSENVNPLRLWRRRFGWMAPHALAAGSLGLAFALANGEVGLAAPLALTVVPLGVLIVTAPVATAEPLR